MPARCFSNKPRARVVSRLLVSAMGTRGVLRSRRVVWRGLKIPSRAGNYWTFFCLALLKNRRFASCWPGEGWNGGEKWGNVGPWDHASPRRAHHSFPRHAAGEGGKERACFPWRVSLMGLGHRLGPLQEPFCNYDLGITRRIIERGFSVC